MLKKALIKNILIAVLSGLAAAGIWVWAGTSSKTIIDPNSENPARVIIDPSHAERKTIIKSILLNE